MKSSRENLAVFEVIRRWMPELRKAAHASGQGAEALLEKALREGLPKSEEVDLLGMLADAEASGFEPVEDLDRWQANREHGLRSRLS